MPRGHTNKRRRAAPRRPGRPAEESGVDIRAALLEAARVLFLKHGFAKVSSRQIAAAAHTTPAMIHYYFEDKHGLFREIVAQAIAPFAESLASAFASAPAKPIDPAALLSAHMRTGEKNPWLPTLLINEVFAESGELRADFIREIAGRIAPLLVKTLDAARARGTLRSTLDPKLTALSFISLCAFPWIARGVIEPVLGLRLEGADLDRLVHHTVELFRRGCAA